jgi:hypothetical protein
MGFNPNRKYKRRPADIYLVAFTLLLTVALIAWAFIG